MIRQIDCCTDEDGNEAIYVNGVLEDYYETVHACDIVVAAKNEPVLLRHHNTESDNKWPTKLDQVKLIVEEPTLFKEE